MLLSIENHVLRKRFGDEKAIAMLAEAGFDAIDFSFYWMKGEENFLDGDYIGYAKQVRAWAEAKNMKLNQAHAPFDLNLSDPKEKQKYDYEQIRRAIACAGVMGIPHIIVHNLVCEDFHNVNLKFFRSLEADAAAAGVKIAVENLWNAEDGRIFGGRYSTAAELRAVLEELGDANFCGCVDLGHAAIVGEDPAAFVRELGGKWLTALHVQDTDFKTDRHLLPYQGDHDWAAICAALRDINYSGDMTFEIFGYFWKLPDEVLPEALRLAHAVGRKLIALT